MARKKKRRTKKQSKLMKLELLGLLFIFLSIFGSGASAISDGAIPGWLEHFFQLFLGIWYFVASVFLFITGMLLLVKRKFPDFWSRKMVGFYILFAGILLLTHIQMFESLRVSVENTSVIGTTWTNFVTYMNGTGTAIQIGGGMAGAIIFAFCNYLFSLAGAKIVAVFSMLIGIIFITELSVGDLFAKLFAKVRLFFANQIMKWKESRTEKKQHKAERKQTEPEEEMGEEGLQEQEEPFINDFTDIAYAAPEPDSEPEGTDMAESEQQEPEEAEDLDHPMPMTATENYDYVLPSPNLLAEPAHNSQQQEKSQIQATARKLDRTFKSFGGKGKNYKGTCRSCRNKI